MALGLRCDSGAARRFAAALRRDAAAMMRAAGLERCELSIALVSDAAMRELNRAYRGQDRPTDVLSFSQVEEKGKRRAPIENARGLPLGDVVISIDTALAQARELAVIPAARLRTLLIHGFLHLLGYDHERSRAEARRMFARERELAAAISGKAKTKLPGVKSAPKAARGNP